MQTFFPLYNKEGHRYARRVVKKSHSHQVSLAHVIRSVRESTGFPFVASLLTVVVTTWDIISLVMNVFRVTEVQLRNKCALVGMVLIWPVIFWIRLEVVIGIIEAAQVGRSLVNQ